MTADLSPEAWAQVRYEYEQTDKPVEDICFDHGISSGTLRDRVRRWRWTRRRQPIPDEGPPPLPPVEPAPLVPLAPSVDAGAAPGPAAAPQESPGVPAPQVAPSEETPVDPAQIVPRLQGAVARVLPAIETTVAKLAAGPMHPREMERAARTLTSLTRTLRELNGLLSQYPAPQWDRGPEDPDEFALELMRRLDAFKAAKAARAAETGGDLKEGSLSAKPEKE
jgi:FAD/FMN-containing dehydrogenase